MARTFRPSFTPSEPYGLTSSDAPSTVNPVLAGAGNVLRTTVSRLLAEDAVFHRVQQALLSTRDLRRTVDRNVGRLLAGLNIPSHQEVDRLYDDIRVLEENLAALTARTQALVAARESTASASPHETVPRTSPSVTEPSGQSGISQR